VGFCVSDSCPSGRHSGFVLPATVRLALPLAGAAFALCALAAAAGEPSSPVRVEGFEDATLRDGLIAVLPARAPPQSLFEAERLAEEAADISAAFLRAEGFFQGEAAAIADDDPPRAVLKINPGPRFSFAEPTVTFAADRPPPAALAALLRAIARHVSDGAPARSDAVRAAELDALAALRAAGFADAATLPRVATVDHATTKMTLTFKFDIATAAPVRLGALQIAPADLLNPNARSAAQTWRSGDAYTPAALADLRRTLQSSGAFARVDVRLADSNDPDGLRPVIATLTPAPPRTLDLSGSWSSAEGIGAAARWSYRNGLKRGETASLGVTLAENEQLLSVGLSEPRGAEATRRLSVAFSRQNTAPFERTGVELGAAIDTRATAKNGLSLGAVLSYNQFDAIGADTASTVLNGYGEWRRNSADDRFDPSRGSQTTLRLEPSVSVGDAPTGFVRAIADARLYHSPAAAADATAKPRVTLAGRLKLGWAEPVFGDENDLPLDRRFYAGGGGSVRGYGFNSIFPAANAARAIPPGGRGLIETSLEARARFGGGWGLAAFVDAGGVADNITKSPQMRFGAGLGVRYDLGFAPLRIDVAAPLSRRRQDAAASVYVSLGQAF
jgi:translocation and assembly module TamA